MRLGNESVRTGIQLVLLTVVPIPGGIRALLVSAALLNQTCSLCDLARTDPTAIGGYG